MCASMLTSYIYKFSIYDTAQINNVPLTAVQQKGESAANPAAVCKAKFQQGL